MASTSSSDPNKDGPAGEIHQDRFVGTRDLTSWPTPVGRYLQTGVHKLARRLGPHSTLILILVVGLAVAFALSVVVVRIYDSVADANGVAGFDKPLLTYVMTLRSPVLDKIITGYTDIAGPIGMPIIAVVALLVLSIHRRSWTPAILTVAAGAGSLLMTIAGKDLIGRVRPPLVDAVPPYEYSPSFPSGHSLNAVVIAGIIIYLLILRQKSLRTRIVIVTVGVLFALTIGLSRVFLGHHWLTDVLAGWLLGALWLSMVITAHRLYLTVRARR